MGSYSNTEKLKSKEFMYLEMKSLLEKKTPSPLVEILEAAQ